jgi:hypothetical protein
VRLGRPTFDDTVLAGDEWRYRLGGLIHESEVWLSSVF